MNTDATRWALSVPLPSSRQVGADRVGRVLVALAQYVDAEGVAWPSTVRLAEDVSGVTRRDVENALRVLAEAGVIERTTEPRPGRAMRWRLCNLPGIPGRSSARRDSRPAGHPQQVSQAQPAGEPAGEPAGDPRHEEKRREPLPPTPRSALADRGSRRGDMAGESRPRDGGDALRAAGVPEQSWPAAFRIAAEDPETQSPRARLAVPAYAERIAQELRAQAKAEREAELRALPPCPEHNPAGLDVVHYRLGACVACAADHRCGEHRDVADSNCHLCSDGPVVNARGAA